VLNLLSGNESNCSFSDLTEAEVRRELNLEEECQLASGGVMIHGTSASSFIMMGLDIEETQ
jgi:hypothetical protein